MAQSGYYRFPSIQGELIVFASEDDLWSVPAGGGVARRLTSSVSEAARPALSPDGTWLAFTAREEGHNELYSMPSVGGESKRLTFFGANTRPVGWSLDGARILFATNHGEPFNSTNRIYAIHRDGGAIEPVNVGSANSISFSPTGGVVIGRNTADPARWKRYRGGTAGDLWVDATGSGTFTRLITLKGNLASPMWIGSRIYFLSDHEGYGNIYSCVPDGTGIQRHTDHIDFYVRNPSTDGSRITYHAGGDLFLYDPATDTSRILEIEYHSPETQRSRKFVNGADFVQSYALHPEGHMVALTLRGKPITMGAFSGPVTQHGEPQGVRYRLLQYLNDGKRLIALSDKGGEERLVIFSGDAAEPEDRFEEMDLGRPIFMKVSPCKEMVAISNQRNETIIVDLEKREMRIVDRSKTLHDNNLAWSPDGRWLAFNHAENAETSYLMIANAESGQTHIITEPLLSDVSPAFDPEGKYLYFLSYREFNPVYDNLHFDLGFPRGVKPYLITLRKDIPNPFLVAPAPPSDLKVKALQEAMAQEKGDRKDEQEKEAKKKPKEIEIDFDGITRRIQPFPIPEGKFSQIMGIKGKVLFVSHPIQGSLDDSFYDEPQPTGKLESYDFDSTKTDLIANNITAFDLSRDGNTLIYRAGKRIRVLKAGPKPDPSAGNEPGRESGWVDLSRARIPILPPTEWRQMFREAWRLQRDFFWTEGMLGIDWNTVYTTYLPLLDRLGSRGELSDLIWEMHGELGTSHAYEMGGDYRKSPTYRQGFLGADFTLDAESNEWVISHIIRGDAWSTQFGSPLEAPGVNVSEGDHLIAINGRRLSSDRHPYEQLTNMAMTEVSITVRGAQEKEPRTITVKATANERLARYREWVNTNREKVHAATDGKVGYVHIPDMGPFGYSEFHRGFLSEVGRGSLIVDVRFNGGGHVSQLILEKLSRRVLGYNFARYTVATSYPDYALSGPIVAITNENAGSDGDIFSHGFKMLKLGPLVGKRTWGGVVGIWPRNPLADGSVTTQPEFSFWFRDVEWGVENYGTDPDIDVDIAPQDYAAGRDTQLERALSEIERLTKEAPPGMPKFAERPRLAPMPLPLRNGEG